MSSLPDSPVPSKRPLVSVITVVYNCVATLEDTILSVVENKGDDVEFIVIDGGSKDGTVDLLHKHDARIDKWISERDAGIYDAMNKGLERAEGEYVFFLGGDDLLRSVPRQELAAGPDLLLCTVDCGTWKFVHGPMSKFRRRMKFRNMVHSQGAFYRHSDLRFDLRYRYCSDYQYSLDVLKIAHKVEFSQEVVSLFSVNGASSGFKPKLEMIAIAWRNHGLFWSGISILYCACSLAIDKVKRAIH